MYRLPFMDRHSLEDATGLGSDELRSLMHFIVAKSLVEKSGSGYRRTPLGTMFIEHMLMHPASEEERRECLANKHKHQEI